MEYYEGGKLIGKTNKSGRVSSTYQTCNQQKQRDKWNWYSKWNEFNKVFNKHCSEVDQKNPNYSQFESFLNKIDTTMAADSITINKLKEAFFYP